MREIRPINYVPDNSLLSFVMITDNSNISSFRKAKYLCECGGEIEAYIGNVKTGKTYSCGCKRYVGGNYRHGLSNHPLYRVWENMISRCYNNKVKAYRRYGGRGVIMCEEWKSSPEIFIKWGLENGWKLGLQLDKDIIGNGFLYSPESCCFVTAKTNNNHRSSNKIITFGGISKTLSQWSDQISVSQSVLCVRLKKWGIERALTTPLIKHI